MIDWLVHWFFDWLIAWLIDFSIACSLDWLIDFLIACSLDWLIDCLIDWFFDWLIDCLIDWFFDCSFAWLIDWLFDWLPEVFSLHFCLFYSPGTLVQISLNWRRLCLICWFSRRRWVSSIRSASMCRESTCTVSSREQSTRNASKKWRWRRQLLRLCPRIWMRSHGRESSGERRKNSGTACTRISESAFQCWPVTTFRKVRTETFSRPLSLLYGKLFYFFHRKWKTLIWFFAGMTVHLQSENGILGLGNYPDKEHVDPDLVSCRQDESSDSDIKSHWLIDWLKISLMDWAFLWSIDWLMRPQLAEQLFDWLIDWRFDGWSERFFSRLIDWLMRS